VLQRIHSEHKALVERRELADLPETLDAKARPRKLGRQFDAPATAAA
jgi:hypothetical protein